MGQCTSCSTQRPNFNSSVPQTPEFELNPDNFLFAASRTLPTRTTATPVHLPSTAEKIRFRLKPKAPPAIAAPEIRLDAPKPQDKDSPHNIFMTSTNSPETTIHRKPSRKDRVSPQTNTSSIPKSVFWNKNKANDSSDNVHKKSKNSSLISLRKFFLQSKSTTNTSKDKSTDCTQPQLVANDKDDNEGSQVLGINKFTTESSISPTTTDEDNSALSSLKPTTAVDNFRGLTSSNFNCPDFHSPISPHTLQDLNSSREEKRILRERFFLGINENTLSIPSSLTPKSLHVADMESNLNSVASSRRTVTNNFGFASRQSKVPEKVKRTFQYQPAQNANKSGNVKLYSTNRSTNNNTLLQQPEYFNNNLYEIRKQPSPTRILQTENTQGARRSPVTSATNEVSFQNLNNIKLSGVSKPGMTLKKPEASRPFYTILYPNRNQNNTRIPTPPSTSFKGGFDNVNTGIVLQRKMFYQEKITEEKSAKSRFPKNDDLARSSTWVKDTISSSAKRNEKEKVLPKSQSTDNNLLHKKSFNFNSSGREFSRSRHGTKMKTNFPVQRDSSTSSGDFTTKRGGDKSDNPHSDIEFLDDEISDQPDLTLTFKELSPSSSGESLVSCELTLDSTISTLKRNNSSHRNELEVASDSAFSDISSANFPSLTTSKASSESYEMKDRLSPTTCQPRNGHLVSTTSSLLKQKLVEPNFILRNIHQTGRPQTQTTKLYTDRSPKHEKYSNSGKGDSSKQDIKSDKVKASPEKSPARSLRRYGDNSSPSEEKQKDEVKESFLKTLMEDVNYLKSQLSKLKEELEEKEKVDGEKDKVIEKLMLEIDLLKRVGANAIERKNSTSSNNGKSLKCTGIQLNCEPLTMNAAAQTDSDLISPVRGLSYDDYDKFGETVSFRLGRRISPSSTTPNASDAFNG